MLLPAVTAFSVPFSVSRYADCARQMGMVAADADDKTATRVLLEDLQQLNQDLEVPTPEDYGIDRKAYMELLPTMAQQAIASGSPANNPVIPEMDEIMELYQQVYSCRDAQPQRRHCKEMTV